MACIADERTLGTVARLHLILLFVINENLYSRYHRVYFPCNLECTVACPVAICFRTVESNYAIHLSSAGWFALRARSGGEKQYHSSMWLA